MVAEAPVSLEPPVALVAAYPIYAVDLGQRITSWDERASAQLRAGDDVLGRRCYEVLASIDPRNAALCRPNCPVISLARTGRPAQDFEVWAQSPDGDSCCVRVSILLQDAEDRDRARVIHMVRRVEDPAPASGGLRGRPHRLLRPTAKHAGDPSIFPEPPCSITPRQGAALRLLADGYSPEEIAAVMEVRPITVRNHIQAAMDRLGARTRLEAVIMASRAGLLGEAV